MKFLLSKILALTSAIPTPMDTGVCNIHIGKWEGKYVFWFVMLLVFVRLTCLNISNLKCLHINCLDNHLWQSKNPLYQNLL